MLKKITASFATLVLALLSFVTLSLMSVAPASASESKKEAICHATGSESNPYTQELVPRQSIVSGQGDNGVHEGDIVPPFTYNFDGGSEESYPGKNWTDENKAIWSKGCSTATVVLTPVLPVAPVQTCTNPNPVFSVPAQPSGINITSAADDKGGYIVSYELPKNTPHARYAFPEGFVNDVAFSTVDNRPFDAMWDASKGACNLPDTGAGDIKSEHILYAGILIFAGLALTTLARRRNA